MSPACMRGLRRVCPGLTRTARMVEEEVMIHRTKGLVRRRI